MPPGSIESRTLASKLCTFHWHHTASRRILFYVQHGVRPQGRKLSTHSSPPLIASQTLWKRAAFGLGLYWRALERGFRNRPCRVKLRACGGLTWGGKRTWLLSYFLSVLAQVRERERPFLVTLFRTATPSPCSFSCLIFRHSTYYHIYSWLKCLSPRWES